MGIVDKAKNAAEDAVGKVKETVGDVTGNDDLKAEGQKDQGVSGVKKVGENIKDKLSWPSAGRATDEWHGPRRRPKSIRTAVAQSLSPQTSHCRRGCQARREL